MFEMLVKFIFYIVSRLASLIFTPIIGVLTALFPSLDSIITNVKFFLTEYVFYTLQWTKMLCINTLAFPQELLNFLASVFTILISIHTAMLLYKGVITIYQKLKP